jgi:glucokinase
MRERVTGTGSQASSSSVLPQPPDALPRYVLGLDIGGTKLAAGVVNPAGTALSFLVQPTGNGRNPDTILGELFALGRRAVAEGGVDWSVVSAVGIGCGGPLDAERGVLLAPPHLAGWRDIPLAEIAERELGRPAFIENDGTAAASAEHRHGAGAGARNMVYLTISTGVGGGVVMNGQLYRGATGNGGELGHVTVDWKGRVCRGCGRRGCLEAYVSGTSIAERAVEAMTAGSSLAGKEVVTAADVTAAARDKDTLASRIWAETLEALACGLTSIVNLFEPEVVVLGGGVTRAGGQLLHPVREMVVRQAMIPAGQARIVTAGLGDRVGVVGAASFVYERALARRDDH